MSLGQNLSLVFEKLLEKQKVRNDKNNTKECSAETRFHSASKNHWAQIIPDRFTASKTAVLAAVYGLLYAFLRIQILTKNNEISLFFQKLIGNVHLEDQAQVYEMDGTVQQWCSDSGPQLKSPVYRKVYYCPVTLAFFVAAVVNLC